MYSVFEDLLKKHHCKAADVAKATKIHPSTFSDWKKGKSTPKIDKLKKIADFFDVSIEYLQTGKKPSFNDEFFYKLSFESFLKSIGWEVSRTHYEEGMPCDKCRLDIEPVTPKEKELYPFGMTSPDLCKHCLKDDNHYILTNGEISVNVSDDEFENFKNNIRFECINTIKGFIDKSADFSYGIAAHDRKHKDEPGIKQTMSIEEMKNNDLSKMDE